MKVHIMPCGKKLLPLPIVLLLVLSVLSVLSVNIVEVSAVEYPAIYMDPALIMDPMLTPGTNFSVSIRTDYNGTDIWVWEFLALSYNPSVLQGGIQGTDMWTADGVNETFDTTVKPLVPDSEVIRVNGTLMTIETEGNDTWTGDGVKTTFDTTPKPLVSGSEVIRVNGTLMTIETEGNDTWTGDGITKTFNTTKKPLVPVGDVEVYVNETLQIPGLEYTVDYSEGIIELKTVPGVGAEIKVTYEYGHYTVDYSEGTINFFTAPGVGADIEATYIYRQYAMNYTEGKITFAIAPSAGAEVEVTYLYGGITNGDLITTDKHSSARFKLGTFNNTSGRLSYTSAWFFYIQPPIPVTSGPGTLATVTFTVVGKGTSDITLEKPVLGGGYEGEAYHIINDTMPDHIGHGYFSNLPSIYVDPATIVEPDLTPGTNFTVSIFTNYYNETDDVWGWEFTLTYDPSILQGIGVNNGDLITTEKHPNATFIAGTFDNTLGKLSLTGANFSYAGTPLPVTSGPGTLASINFTVVDRGASNITLGSETKLIGVTEEGAGVKYNIIDYTMPDQIWNGFFDNTVHDIAVTNVTASPDTVKIGEPVSINVTVTNEGDYSETFNVTAYYDNTTIGTQPVTNLAALSEVTLTFTWNTTGVTSGNYTISAYATPVLGEEDTTDNTFTNVTVTVEETPPTGMPWYVYVAAGVAAAVIIAAVAFYFLKIKKPKPT